MGLRNVVSKLQGLLKWLKKPWEITGPVASPEFKDPYPSALEYRKFSPATPSARPYIPHAQPENVYNIVYYTRDSRRQPRDRKVIIIDPKNDPDLPELEKLPPSPLYYKAGILVDADDNPNDGYQR